jgi:hypothetical protein
VAPIKNEPQIRNQNSVLHNITSTTVFLVNFIFIILGVDYFTQKFDSIKVSFFGGNNFSNLVLEFVV